MDLPSLPPVSPQQLGEGRGELCKGGGEAGRRVQGTIRKEKGGRVEEFTSG